MKKTLPFAPGIYSDAPGSDAPGRWKDGDRVRWRNGLPQKIGGWQKLILSSGDRAEFRGLCRKLLDWTDLAGQVWVALGTHKRLYVYTNGVLSNITPVRATATLAGPIDTDVTGALDPTGGNDASYFTVTDAAHGADVGDIVTLSGASAVGGITPDGDYEVREIVDASTYTLKHTSAATSTATGGGSVDVVYELAAGAEAASVGTGYGLGSWNTGTWGSPRSGSSQITQPRLWSLDAWGEDLVACPRGGTLYLWDRSVGVGTPAAEVTGAPDVINHMLVSTEDRHLIAFGCNDSVGTFDPLLVRWCDQEDYTNWTISESTTAGEKRLDGGSYILTAIRTNYGILIFTDKTLHVMQFIGPPNIFAIRLVASGVSLIGPNAAIDAQGRVIWAGTGGFHTYDGAVQALPCEVWNKVFGDTQTIQGWQVTAALNTDFTEVRWDYPSATSEQNSRYVALNYAEGHWQRGTMERSAMSDKAALFSYNPYGTDTGGIGISDDTVSTLYIHEVGSDAGDDPMDEYIESWDIHFPDATDVILLNAMNPDFKSIEGEIDFTFRSRLRASQQTPKELTIAGITSTTERVGIRLRGTYISWEVGSDSLGTSWRLGDCEWDWAPDGEAR